MRGYRARRPILDDGTFGPPQVLTARNTFASDLRVYGRRVSTPENRDV